MEGGGQVTLCDDGHDEVCYEGRNCPCCALRAELNETIETYNHRLTALEEDCDRRIAKAEDHFDGLAQASLKTYKAEFGPDWVNHLK